MDNAQLNQQLKLLTARCSDVEHEKKLLTNDYEGLKSFVIKTGLVSLGCLMVRITLLQIFLNSKNVSVKALGRFLSPLDYAVFLVALVLFLINGFDLFLNADTKYSKMAAKKLEKSTVSEKMDELNSEIMRLQYEIGQAETTLYEQGGKPEYKEALKTAEQTEAVSQASEKRTETVSTKISGSGQTSDSMAEEAFAEEAVPEESQPEVLMKRAVLEERIEVKKVAVNDHRDEEKNVFTASTGKNCLDDILNGLDDFSLDDDEDEFENSSDLWEQDAMKHYK